MERAAGNAMVWTSRYQRDHLSHLGTIFQRVACFTNPSSGYQGPPGNWILSHSDRFGIAPVFIARNKPHSRVPATQSQPAQRVPVDDDFSDRGPYACRW